jgi:hypothetical protein
MRGRSTTSSGNNKYRRVRMRGGGLGGGEPRMKGVAVLKNAREGGWRDKAPTTCCGRMYSGAQRNHIIWISELGWRVNTHRG